MVADLNEILKNASPNTQDFVTCQGVTFYWPEILFSERDCWCRILPYMTIKRKTPQILVLSLFLFFFQTSTFPFSYFMGHFHNLMRGLNFNVWCHSTQCNEAFFSPLNKNFIANIILLNSLDRKLKMCSSSAR